MVLLAVLLGESRGGGVMLWVSGRVLLMIGMGRLIAIYDRSNCMYFLCKVWKVRLEVGIRIRMKNAWKLRVSEAVEETAPSH